MSVLLKVPAGLTPIRTRSDDYEADLANAHAMRGPPSPVIVRVASVTIKHSVLQLQLTLLLTASCPSCHICSAAE